MRPGKPSSAKLESLDLIPAKKNDHVPFSADKGYVLVVDVTCVKSLWSSYGVISPDSPSRGCQGEWMVLRGVLSPDSPSRGCEGEWIVLFAETTRVADARDVRGRRRDARVVVGTC